MGRKSIFRAVRDDDRGTVGIWMALASTVIVGAGALAVDLGSLYATHGQLQHTADSAALAAVNALPDVDAATAAAQAYAEKNMPAAANGSVMAASDVISGNWDTDTRTFTAGATPLNALRIVTRRAQANGNAAPTYFARALGRDSVDVVATATAAKLTEAAACVTALSPDGEGAMSVAGTASVQTYDCAIQVNSCDDAALKAQGNVVVNVVDVDDPENMSAEINVCGGAEIKGSATLTPAPNTYTGKQVDDPFAGTAKPDAELYDDAADCTYTNFSASDDVDLYPGVYCGGITLTGSGTATFHGTGGSLENGLYIVKDGALSVGGNINATGDGVTFFMTGASARIDFGGTADIGLTAPTTGPLAGFIFFGDPDNPATGAHLIRGTTLGGYNGYIYLPGAGVSMTGTSNGTAGTSDCTVIVSDTFENSGTPDFEAKAACSNYGGALSISRTALVN